MCDPERTAPPGTVELFRPVGQMEADLIKASGCRSFPPRLPFQPIFYPVSNLEYAREIAERWNTKDASSGFVGYVTRFLINADYLGAFELHQVGDSHHTEYWILSEQLGDFNLHIVGRIEFVAEFRAPQ